MDISDFDKGVMWAAFFLVSAYDQPSMAADICREAGIRYNALKRPDVADQKAAAAIRREYRS